MQEQDTLEITNTGVLTTYKIGNSQYASYILGACPIAIQQAIQQRNLNEIVESKVQEIKILPNYLALNDHEFEENLPQILHSCCYLSYIALKSNTVDLEEILGDEGVVHEISHYLCSIGDKTNNSLMRLRELLSFLQKKATGIYEPV